MDDFSKYETDSQAYEQIALISKMDDLAYGMQRKEISTQLGVNLKTFDNLRKQKQADYLQEASDDIVENTSPWHNPIDSVEIGNDLQRLIFHHLALKHEEYATAIVLWSFSTWFIDAWQIMPHLFFRSLAKGSGKTKALQIVEAFSARSYVCSNITSAALFRVIEKHSPTLILDEVDRYLAAKDELNGIMNAGHTRRTATVTRLEERDGDYIPRKFNVFGGKCMAGIGKQLDTMMDRSIIIKMEKRLQDESVTKLPLTFFENQNELRRKIARFAEDKKRNAMSITPDVPNLGNDRAQDNWLPLFIVADLIGSHWPERCLAAYRRIEAISAEDAKEQELVVVRILRELAPHLEKRVGQWVPSEELRTMLIGDENSEFFDWYQGNPISAKSIKKYLVKEAGVAHERQSRGSVYSLTDLNELVQRYAHA